MQPPHRHAVTAATVFDGQSRRRNAAVVVEDDHVAWIGARAELPDSMRVHVLPGETWLAPGFIDVQVNGGGDVLFNAKSEPSALLRMAQAHRRFGTTSIMATLISDTREAMSTAIDVVKGIPAESGVLGIHFEGPFLSPEKPGVHDPGAISVPKESDLAMLTSLRGRPTLVTLAPERSPPAFISALARSGVRVSLGHSMATYEEAKRALESGLTGFTHLFNAMRALSSRDPGPIAAALETSGAWFGMIVDGIHVHPAMLRMALRGKACPMLVTDAMPPVGGSVPSFKLKGSSIEARGSACWRDDGVLAGTAMDMASAVRNCVRLLDAPLVDALRYATTEPARFLGVDDMLGRLAPGSRADMVALEPENIRVLGTWLAGRWEPSEGACPPQQGR